MREVSGSELAELTGRTWRTVKSLLEAAGIQPKRRQGRSDLYDSTTALRAIYLPESSGADPDGDQRQRLAAAQSEKVEMENAVRRGELADMRDVEKAWTDCIANARVRVLAMPSKLSPRLVNIGDANLISAAIRAEVHAALAELADYAPSPGEPDGVDPQGGEDMGTAAGPDSQPVGRPRKKAKQRKRRRARPMAD